MIENRFARETRFTNQARRNVIYATLIIGAILFMGPLYIMVAMSLKSEREIANTSMWTWPENLTFDNYRLVLTDPGLDFTRKMLNTLFLATVPTVGTVFTAAMVAYGFARLRFAGRDRLFLVLLSTMMLPGVVTMIPSYMMFAKLHWINTYYPFVVPAFFGGGAFNIFFIRQYILSIPREMDEAAKIDGASHAVIFWRVILPNCTPVLATLAVFGFVGAFKDFLGPLMMLNDPEKMNLEVGLRSLQQAHKTDWHLMMAGSCIVLVPIFIVFALCQNYFIRGISLSAGK